MYCEHCGLQIPVDVSFCNHCGKAVATENHRKSTPPLEAPLTILAAVSRGKRFLNWLIDLTLFTLVLIVIAAFGDLSNSDGTSNWSLWFLLLAYYWVSESSWQTTLGKRLTKTKVVNYNGTKPTVLDILGRTLARCIPFEVFSFLFAEHGRGWHDTLSNTLVVSSHYTESDVKNLVSQWKSNRSS